MWNRKKNTKNNNRPILRKEDNIMFRVGVIKLNGDSEAQNFETKTQAEEWILSIAEDIKKSVLVNKENLNDRQITNW